MVSCQIIEGEEPVRTIAPKIWCDLPAGEILEIIAVPDNFVTTLIGCLVLVAPDSESFTVVYDKRADKLKGGRLSDDDDDERDSDDDSVLEDEEEGGMLSFAHLIGVSISRDYTPMHLYAERIKRKKNSDNPPRFKFKRTPAGLKVTIG